MRLWSRDTHRRNISPGNTFQAIKPSLSTTRPCMVPRYIIRTHPVCTMFNLYIVKLNFPVSHLLTKCSLMRIIKTVNNRYLSAQPISCRNSRLHLGVRVLSGSQHGGTGAVESLTRWMEFRTQVLTRQGLCSQTSLRRCLPTQADQLL